MSNEQLSDTDLILNEDGSVYHLHLLDENIADHIIIVGDPGRVFQVSRHFDSIDFEMQNREFITQTGRIGNKRITVLSTGIGTDNIDIVINELDSAVNIDPVTRLTKSHQRKLNIVRIGTSGTIQEDIPVGAQLISQYGLGFDGVMHYYNYDSDASEKLLTDKITEHLQLDPSLAAPYVCKVNEALFGKLKDGMVPGITATAGGFYAPQGRSLRLKARYPDLNDHLSSFKYEHHRITNFEMETSAFYGLGNMLGHQCCTCCAIIANRVRKEFNADYQRQVERLTKAVLERIF